MEYLFLVPVDGVWTQSSVDGLPLKTTDADAFMGMPQIQASPFIQYKSWEEHVEETINESL